MRVRICYRARRPVERPHFLCAIKRSDQTLCCNFSSYYDKVDLASIIGDGTIELLTPPLKIASDRYTIQIGVREKSFGQLLSGQIGASFHLRHEVFQANEFGVFHEPGQWSLMESFTGHMETVTTTGGP
jgi:lipopolysaccharide transport system ATP-binding protein